MFGKKSRFYVFTVILTPTLEKVFLEVVKISTGLNVVRVWRVQLPFFWEIHGTYISERLIHGTYISERFPTCFML